MKAEEHPGWKLLEDNGCIFDSVVDCPAEDIDLAFAAVRRDAFRRGAEAMREAIAVDVGDDSMANGAYIRAVPLPTEDSDG